MGTPFHQYLFDLTPKLEQELVWDLFGIIKKRNFVDKIRDSLLQIEW
jgi:hypothetical protein